MAKRTADSDGDSPHPKRQKTTKILPIATTERHEIRSSGDLQLLLAFDQDVGPVLRQKIQSFKSFLASIACGAGSDDRLAKRALLLHYLQSQSPPEGKDESAYLGDIIKTWHFAAQSKIDSLFASVVAVLALLLKSTSSFVEFREYGNRLCTTVLHDDQIKLFDRGLDTHRAKDYLISPCLQLLTEVVSFDGGHAARKVYRQREITFKRLDVFLGMRKEAHGDTAQNAKRRSVRENALGYLFTNLRLQSPAAKMNIIAQGKVQRALLNDVMEDSSSIILEILEVLRQDIAMDAAISQTAKGRFFNQWTLGRLATLYGYNEHASLSDNHQGIQRSVHDFLVFLCTSPGCGLVEMRTASNGGVDAVAADETVDSLSKPYTTDRHDAGNRRAGRNPRLELFLQSLKPYASVPQCDLILAVFRHMPELIPGYFSSGKSFSFDPKLTSTWVGYSSFLLAAIEIPLPESLTTLSVNDAVPPSYGKVMESIIPKPCTQKLMTRCLNQSVNLVKFFTLQLLNVAFEKFAKVLQICEDIQHYTDDQKNRLAWFRVVSELRDDFCGRVPELKHVITQFRNCAKGSTMLRESTIRLIASYYKVIPQLALEEKFDISVTLSTALTDVESSDESHKENGIRLLELGHLLEIACRSPDMQWWHKPDSMWLSPFTMLLKLHLDRIQVDTRSQQIRTLLKTVVRESQILRSDVSMTSLDSLVLSLQGFEDCKASSRMFGFIDNCILRLVRKPVHYFDILTDLVAAAELDINPRDCQVDLLLIAIMEQWHFLVKSADATTVSYVSRWVVRFIEVIDLGSGYVDNRSLHGGSTRLLSHIRNRLKAEVQDKFCRPMFEKTPEKRPYLGIPKEAVAASTISKQRPMSKSTGPLLRLHPKAPETFVPPGPPEEHEDHPGLHQWTRHEVQDAISEGHVKELILCLCSKYVEIRKQALIGVRAFMRKLKVSGYSEWQQVYILAGEIVETAEKIVADGPLAYYAGVLAADLFLVLGDPLHLMYSKANKFMNRGPEWNVTKLPSYWVDKVLMNPPTDDDGHHQEAEWLLDGLIDGLRTSADMDIYRRCHIFERLLSFSASPSLPESYFQKILDLLFRCTYVNGSSTLITRCGLMSWISSRIALHAISDLTGERLESLASRAIETSDQERVDIWTNGTLVSIIDSLQIRKRR